MSPTKFKMITLLLHMSPIAQRGKILFDTCRPLHTGIMWLLAYVIDSMLMVKLLAKLCALKIIIRFFVSLKNVTVWCLIHVKIWNKYWVVHEFNRGVQDEERWYWLRQSQVQYCFSATCNLYIGQATIHHLIYYVLM